MVNLSKTRKLSGNFIRWFKDKLDWFYTSYYQTFYTKDFILESIDEIYFDVIGSNKSLADIVSEIQKEKE